MGGLKSIQIVDNGTGILKENLDILCERFTTSKLKSYEDLQQIGTYGFRGEALSSISMISRVTLQTKTKDEIVAYKVKYENGNMMGKPVPCAGNQGTSITIEDLFYNVPIRQKTLKSPFDEFSKIFDCISKYAVHNYKISFTLKKYGENNSIKTQISESPIDIVRVIFGNEVANSLLKVKTGDEGLKFQMEGYISNANYSGKKGQFLLFINHRLVESKSLKKALFDDLYRTVLPNTVQPFIYMSIEIDPRNVDVNVSPTKHEVSFLNEDLIVENIKNEVEAVLLKTNETRKMYTQQLLPGAAQITFETSLKEKDKIYAKDMIRTDPKSQSIIKFLNQSTESPNVSQIVQSSPETRKLQKKQIESTSLSSIKELMVEVEKSCNQNLKEQLKSLKFVGNVDRTKSLIQCENVLYLCDTRRLGWELFYQLSLKYFENFDVFEFEDPLDIKELAMIGFNLEECSWNEDDGPKEELSKQVESILLEHKEMLQEYFSITITDKGLQSLPIIIQDYAPVFGHLPMFIVRLAADVNFDDEKECFKNICSELATFYSKWSVKESNEKEFEYLMEHVIFPKIQSHLQPPEKFVNDETFLKLTSLQELYKVFERC
ncbi:DNA mismatch repair protein Mlh1 isoform X2 [Chironomus tepperi]